MVDHSNITAIFDHTAKLAVEAWNNNWNVSTLFDMAGLSYLGQLLYDDGFEKLSDLENLILKDIYELESTVSLGEQQLQFAWQLISTVCYIKEVHKDLVCSKIHEGICFSTFKKKLAKYIVALIFLLFLHFPLFCAKGRSTIPQVIH